MNIVKVEITNVIPVIKEIPYFHPEGKFRIPIVKKETMSNGKVQNINSGKYFWKKEDANEWLQKRQKNISK